MDQSPDVFLNYVLAVIEQLGGRRLPNGADKLIGADHGLTGWDSIWLLEDLQKAYSVDLRQFADKRAYTERLVPRAQGRRRRHPARAGHPHRGAWAAA